MLNKTLICLFILLVFSIVFAEKEKECFKLYGDIEFGESIDKVMKALPGGEVYEDTFLSSYVFNYELYKHPAKLLYIYNLENKVIGCLIQLTCEARDFVALYDRFESDLYANYGFWARRDRPKAKIDAGLEIALGEIVWTTVFEDECSHSIVLIARSTKEVKPQISLGYFEIEKNEETKPDSR